MQTADVIAGVVDGLRCFVGTDANFSLRAESVMPRCFFTPEARTLPQWNRALTTCSKFRVKTTKVTHLASVF
jgi:hypothetical protein